MKNSEDIRLINEENKKLKETARQKEKEDDAKIEEYRKNQCTSQNM